MKEKLVSLLVGIKRHPVVFFIWITSVIGSLVSWYAITQSVTFTPDRRDLLCLFSFLVTVMVIGVPMPFFCSDPMFHLLDDYVADYRLKLVGYFFTGVFLVPVIIVAIAIVFFTYGPLMSYNRVVMDIMRPDPVVRVEGSPKFFGRQYYFVQLADPKKHLMCKVLVTGDGRDIISGRRLKEATRTKIGVE